jgi:hypothetical protein
MENIPLLAFVSFILITLVAVFIFYKATRHSKLFLVIIAGWMILQGALALSGFYKATGGLPPRFFLVIGPPMLAIAGLFLTSKGRAFIDNTNLKYLLAIHIIRIPVEGMLFYLFLKKAIPQLMTFEGWNLDVISGLTASLALIVYYSNLKWKRVILLAWNFICLALLINIVVIALLSAPFAFQQLAFDQPNVAILYFPFVYLPAVVVPLVLFSHLAAIRRLTVAYQSRKAPELLPLSI